MHILAVYQVGMDLLVWAILMSKEPSNHILSQDSYTCKQFWTTSKLSTIRQGKNRHTFLGLHIIAWSLGVNPWKDNTSSVRKNKDTLAWGITFHSL